MYLLKFLLFIFLCVFVSSCNKNLSEDEKKDLWSKAQTTGEIYNRSGSNMPNASSDQKARAMRDAETRLTTGGGLFGNEGINVFSMGRGQGGNVSSAGVGMPVNPYLWQASLETISFMPLSSTDPFAGTIITDWYISEANIEERCKLNIFIKGLEFKTSNLQVLSFCQKLKNNQWVNQMTKKDDNIKLENAILNRAKKLKLKSS